jgi:hypothetical protein
MKKQFILLCVALFAVAPICLAQTNPSKPDKSAANETAITDSEKGVWEAYKNKQADAFKNYLASNYCSVYADGIKGRDDEVADMDKTDLRDYSFADTKVVFPKGNVAVITYKVTTHATLAAKDVSGTYNAGSVWAKQGGQWVTVFHTEVKAQ